MPKNSKPFVHIQFDILLNGSAQEAAAPATSFAVCDWSPYGAPRAEKEEVDVGVDLQGCQWQIVKMGKEL